MNIIGRTNKELVHAPSEREDVWKKYHHTAHNGFLDTKKKRVKRFETKKSHSQDSRENKERDFN